MTIEMSATLISHQEQHDSVVSCQYTAAEAAAKLGVAESTIRKTAKKLGVRKIHGRTVAGFIRFSAHPVDVVLPYTA